jgi:acetyl-CoA synthetase
MHYPFQITSHEAYTLAYQESVQSPELFWLKIAQSFQWMVPPVANQVLNWNFNTPDIRWFDGAVLNITENCLDRHAKQTPDRVALRWEPNDPLHDQRSFTYAELLNEVCRFTQVLKNQGVQKGDRVCIYMSMVPELAIAVLACARLGAVHSVVFGGFSAQSISDRLQDAQAAFIITQDGGYRGTKEIALKAIIDEALESCEGVKKVIVLLHSKTPIAMHKGRDYWWQEEMEKIPTHFFLPAEPMQAEDPLFILYTSGSTGKPKGVVHSCAGYMVYTTYTFVNVFQYRPDQVYFCTADIGWITGHSYIVYGPLAAGAQVVLFEGIPTFPDPGRFWDIVEKYQVNILYTAPTAIRGLMAAGDSFVENRNLASLQVLGTVGEPINEEAWQWYYEKVGGGRCPIVDTWWQTETGGIMISNLAGITPHVPAHATLPLPGVQPILMDEFGKEVAGSNAADGDRLPDSTVHGNLCIKFPWPGMIRTTYGDHARCKSNYFETYPDHYFTGDGCFRDSKGNYRITGRVDDVLNVSGHRIGTAEVENAINSYTGVVESAVVGYPHELKGQGIYAFVILGNDSIPEEELNRKNILQTVTQCIGPIAKPDKIQFVQGLPKTRSGKIMRRILRKIAEGETESVGDTTTLLDPLVVEEIIRGRV